MDAIVEIIAIFVFLVSKLPQYQFSDQSDHFLQTRRSKQAAANYNSCFADIGPIELKISTRDNFDTRNVKMVPDRLFRGKTQKKYPNQTR